jgi:hypothetical protein
VAKPGCARAMEELEREHAAAAGSKAECDGDAEDTELSLSQVRGSSSA